MIYGIDISDYSRIEGRAEFSSPTSYSASVSLLSGPGIKPNGNGYLWNSTKIVLAASTSGSSTTVNINTEITNDVKDFRWIGLGAAWTWNVKLTSLKLVP